MLWKCCFLLVVIGLVTSQVSDTKKTIRAETNKNNVRKARFANTNGIFGFFTTLRNIKSLYDDQYNDTANSLRRVMNLVSDGFADTATKKSQSIVESTSMSPNASTTTEKYRISRQELGYILGKNYRGLQKLLRIELNDAANQSRKTIKDYRQEFGKALVPYTVIKTESTTE